MRFTVLAGAVLGLALAGAAAAQSPSLTADQIIAARQAGYDLMNASFADMKRAVDARSAEVKPFKAGAEAMIAWSKVVPALFPPGTDKGNTKALPAVWSDRAGFERGAADLRSAAEQLAHAADANDAAGFATAFQETGKACAACHRNFRARTGG